MILFPNFNETAFDYMRTELSNHADFQNMSAEDQITVLELVQFGVRYYITGCLTANNKDPGMGYSH